MLCSTWLFGQIGNDLENGFEKNTCHKHKKKERKRMSKGMVKIIVSAIAAAFIVQGSYSSACGDTTPGKSEVVKTTAVKQSDTSKSEIVSGKKSEEKNTILVTFIELGSVNCIPCKAMQPVMKEVEEKYGKQVKVVFHDVWTEQGKPFGATYGIRAIPTQVFLDKDGKEYYRHEGFFEKEELVKVLKMKGVK
jgi:thiol-disulfide isomerase/thioredoxin